MAAGIVVEGAEELRRVIDRLTEEAHKELQKALKKCALIVQGAAKKKAPRDTSNYGDSILHEISGDTAIVGTKVHYGPYLEWGTARLSEHPAGGKKSHAPFSEEALANLKRWAELHGMGREEEAEEAALAIAWSIYKRGGLPPRPHFRPAMEENKKKIEEILGEAVQIAIKTVTK